MRFLADECCDAALVDALRGATDDNLLTRAFLERRILLTEDKGFGELVYRLRRSTHGVVLLRFDVADRHLKVPRLRYLLEEATIIVAKSRFLGNGGRLLLSLKPMWLRA